MSHSPSAKGSAQTMTADEMLAKLISFDTVSAKSNLDLITYVKEYLAGHGIPCDLVFNTERTKANLYATIGPDVPGGIVLSGHTDVVPVEGQDWSSDPFLMVERDGNYYGRGTADMKGFVAAALAAVPQFIAAQSSRPVHIALSYDEEVGCTGVGSMIDMIRREKPLPALAIVGEPTMMQVVNAHKGISTLRTSITGFEAHSSRTHEGVSAIAAASRLVVFLEDIQAKLAARGDHPEFDPPHTTISVGTIEGGTAINIIPKDCSFLWEYRCIPGEDEREIVNLFTEYAEKELLPAMRERAPDAAIETDHFSQVPPLSAQPGSPAEELVMRLARQNRTEVVAYATEAGIFQKAEIPTVVCGPGDIAQAHKPDEFLSVTQLRECEAFLTRLCESLGE